MSTPLSRYDAAFTGFYAQRFEGFAERVSPSICDWLASSDGGDLSGLRVLDLCCGTGVLLRHLLERGAEVVGVDASPHALAFAQQRNAGHAARLSLVNSDLQQLSVAGPFDAAVSTYNSLNCLPEEDVLRCLELVRTQVVDGGRLLIDVKTPHGFREASGTRIEEAPSHLLVVQACHDGGRGQTLNRYQGCFDAGGGSLQRFDLTVTHYWLDPVRLRHRLPSMGWSEPQLSSYDDLGQPIVDVGTRSRVVLCAYAGASQGGL